MRLTAMLGVLALIFAAAACETSAGPSAQNAACDSARLAPIQASLQQARSMSDYYDALKSAYPALATAYTQANEAAVRSSDPRAKIACHSVAAEAAMIQAYLPTRERAGLMSAPPQPPAQMAAASAREIEALCDEAPDARRCAFAGVVSAVALSLDAGSRLSDAAASPASTATAAGWRAAEVQMGALRQGAEAWPGLLASAQPAVSQDLARGYMEPIACAAYADGGELRSRPTSGAPDDEAAAESFARSYLSAMTSTARALGLPPAGAGAPSCAATPDGAPCGEAHVAAVLTMCEGRWGLRPGV